MIKNATQLAEYLEISPLNLIDAIPDLNQKIEIDRDFLYLVIAEFLDINEIDYKIDAKIAFERFSFILPDYDVVLDIKHILYDYFKYFGDFSNFETNQKFGLDQNLKNSQDLKNSSNFENHQNYKYYKNRTFEQSEFCEKFNLRYIAIFEPHLFDKNKFNVLKNLILHACNKTKNRIYARKCKISVKPAIEMKQFFEENNLQGYRNAKTAFVLEYENEPVMCYTIGHAFLGKGKYDAEIARGACKLGYSIIGGASKLWNFIINYYSDKNIDNSKGQINSIVYYIDRNFYNGNSMNFLEGQEFIKKQPGFWNYWIENKQLKNREPNRHSEIMDLIKEGKIIEVGNAGTSVNVWIRKNI